jgi:hypothetical protein
MSMIPLGEMELVGRVPGFIWTSKVIIERLSALTWNEIMGHSLFALNELLLFQRVAMVTIP